MAVTAQEHSLRIGVDEAMRRLESGEPVLVLDARGPQAWDAGTTKIQGAIRVSPEDFHIPECWPKDRFTLTSCT